MDADTSQRTELADAAASCHGGDLPPQSSQVNVSEDLPVRPALSRSGTMEEIRTIEVGHRRGRRPVRRRRGFGGDSVSPVSTDYSDSDQSRQRDRGWYHRPPRVLSHHELFSSTETNDRVVYLQPFARKAYITTHGPAPSDFRHWFPLLTAAVPHTWYSFAPTDTITTPSHRALHRSPPFALKLVSHPKPTALKVPSIAASPALKANPGQPPDAPALVYISVQQTVSDYYRNRRYYSPDRQQPADTLQNMYRVVRAGSQEGAAAQALYQAGTSRWSTVFTCVVKDTDVQPRYGLINAYERASSLQQLLDTEDTPDRVLVFY